MKTASAALITLLNSGLRQWAVADLYTFTLVDGTVIRYSAGDAAITIGGNTYALGPKFKRNTIKNSIGLKVENLEITVMAAPTDLLAGVPWLQAVVNGVLDGARVQVDRFMSDSWANTAPDTIYLFNGRVSLCVADRGAAKITVAPDTTLLNINLPRNIFQATCMHTLYDASCTLSKAAYTTSAAATTGSTAAAVNSALGQAAGYFNLGVIEFTTGALAGQRRTVRSFSGGTVTPVTPFTAAPAAGDTFTIYPGCNKVYSGDCSASKFNNQANFKGMPFVPAPETAY